MYSIAVIAIHGVADQAPGATARDLASLLVAMNEPDISYSVETSDSFILPVPVLCPESTGIAQAALISGSKAGVTNVAKVIRQSIRSDFHRAGWVLGGGGANSTMQQADLGTRFTDYLLFKAKRNGASGETYEATRIRMTRRNRTAWTHRNVDIHEMYWADLSRLSGVLPRIVTEVFTMVFRLSRLARDTVDDACACAKEAADASTGDATLKAKARRWEWLAAVQSAIDWAFACLLANLFVQLLSCAGIIAAMGFLRPYSMDAHFLIAGIAPIAAAWWVAYRWGHLPGRILLTLVVAGVVAFGLAIAPGDWVIGLTAVAIAALLGDYALRVAESRFPGARIAGLVIGALTQAALLFNVVHTASALTDTIFLGVWALAAMHTVEYLLCGVMAWWICAGALLILWTGLGLWVTLNDDSTKRSVATGRIGLFVSVASFVMLTMAIWALVTTIVELAVTGLSIAPHYFHVLGEKDPVSAVLFLHDRYLKSTEAFALVAALLLLLAIYVLVFFLPSILAEVKSAIGKWRMLQAWLSTGFNRLDEVAGCVALASAAAAGWFVLHLLGWGGDFSGIAEISKNVLAPLILSAAGLAAAFTAFGGVLSKYVPWIRAPLDMVLDVDNHFREFPRKAIPRARIFARYVALLEHLVEQRYTRIVIVAHSQGTVITAELLRYLQQRAQNAADNSSLAVLGRKLEGNVDLFTAGCPLRQLYAARFPDLYRWVEEGAHTPGKRASALGAVYWTNVYTSGDYVGRWVWAESDAVNPQKTRADPLTVPEREINIGLGAHTHYFELEQKRVASEIDALIKR